MEGDSGQRKAQKVNSKRKRNSTSITFSEDLKKQLCGMVRLKPVIWSLVDPLYRNRDSKMAAWREISTNIGIPVVNCKIQWKSLKDSLYTRLKRKVGKSGDSADEVDFDDNFDMEVDSGMESWSFWNDLKFLETNKAGRITISTSVEAEDLSDKEPESVNDSFGASETEAVPATTSNYSYMSRKRKKDDIASEGLLSGINSLVKLRMTECSNPPVKPEQLNYYSMYANMDRMLTKLPEDTVEDLNIQFLTMIRAEMKKSTNVASFNIEN